MRSLGLASVFGWPLRGWLVETTVVMIVVGGCRGHHGRVGQKERVGLGHSTKAWCRSVREPSDLKQDLTARLRSRAV